MSDREPPKKRYDNTPRMRTYYAWRDMKKRCSSNSDDRKWYFDRGITVCERWKSFSNFLNDMGFKPPGLSLDRINGEIGYFKENCRWATPAEQSRNRRNTIKITLEGKTMCISEWSNEFGIKPDTIFRRLRAGWDVVRALKTEPRRFGR